MEIISREIGLSNVHALKGTKTVFVDTGTYRNTPGMRYELMNMGIKPEDISLIILTHGHFDHCANIHELKEITNAPVLCHRNAVKFLKTGEFDAYIPRGEDGKKFISLVSNNPIDMPAPIDPDIIIDDEDFDLTPYGVDAKIIYTPGHVDSNICVVTKDREAICGDTIIINPFNDFKGTAALICQDEDALKKSFNRLMDEADIFYSGHGGPFKKDNIEY